MITALDYEILEAVKQGLSYAEIAKALNLTEGRVRHRYFRACRILGGDTRI